MEVPLRINDSEGTETTEYRVLELLVDEGDIVNPGEALVVLQRLHVEKK